MPRPSLLAEECMLKSVWLLNHPIVCWANSSLLRPIKKHGQWEVNEYYVNKLEEIIYLVTTLPSTVGNSVPGYGGTTGIKNQSTERTPSSVWLISDHCGSMLKHLCLTFSNTYQLYREFVNDYKLTWIFWIISRSKVTELRGISVTPCAEPATGWTGS